MNIHPIKTEEDYQATLREIESLMKAVPGSPEGERLDVLVTLVEAYERRHVPLESEPEKTDRAISAVDASWGALPLARDQVRAILRAGAMSLALLVLCGCAHLAGGGHGSLERTRQLVSQLSWDSVAEECHYFWFVTAKGSTVAELVRIGKPATPALIEVLTDPSRAAAAHLTLCQIWEWPDGCNAHIDDANGLPFKYKFGNLAFTSNSRDGEPLPAAMLLRNQHDWAEHLASHPLNP